MKVPVSIVVAGRRIRIKYPDTLISDGEASYADVDVANRLIRVSASDHNTGREVFETVFHELVHYGLRTSGLATILGKKLEEAVVEALEERLAPLFVFSPDASVTLKDIDFGKDD